MAIVGALFLGGNVALGVTLDSHDSWLSVLFFFCRKKYVSSKSQGVFGDTWWLLKTGWNEWGEWDFGQIVIDDPMNFCFIGNIQVHVMY